LNSGTSIPASKIYSDAGIVQISPSATNPAYTQQGFKTTYRVVATDAQQGPALANYAAKGLKEFPFVVVSPQCGASSDWAHRGADLRALIDEAAAH